MHKLVDFLMPGNCRRSLHSAAEFNRVMIADVLSLIQCNSSELTCEIKQDRRTTERHNHGTIKERKSLP